MLAYQHGHGPILLETLCVKKKLKFAWPRAGLEIPSIFCSTQGPRSVLVALLALIVCHGQPNPIREHLEAAVENDDPAGWDLVREVFEVMGRASWHTFQVLTKRAERLERVCRRIPIPANVWLGVSVETPGYYSRIRHLARVDAPVRFLSCEPLLSALPELPLVGIAWVIVGGESGRQPRPVQPEWVRQILDQCQKQNVAFFFKQWGGTNKKRTGRDLDGRVWDEMPRSAPPIAVG